VTTKAPTRRRRHYLARIGAAPTWRGRVNHATDWARAQLADLPVHLHDAGFERLMSLIRDLERIGDDGDRGGN
jgi:hypothetical protein